MLNNSIGAKPWSPKINPFIQSPALPKHREMPQPFINPDVFRPSLPSVEVPYEFPIELPTLPGRDDWANLPTPPREIPDWSDSPWQLPQPKEREITLPKDPSFPGKVVPDGVWLLS